MTFTKIAASAVLLSIGFTAPAFAVSCQLPSKKKPSMSFSLASQAPQSWKTGKTPKYLALGLAKRGRNTGKDTQDASHPLDGVEFICDDWIAICANDDCTHGVVECDGDCIDF